jgi:iron complex transport system ATP-binding protein
MKIAIKVNQLTCGYSKNPVLKDLTFEVNSGEFFIVIGPNGSGKTTLVRSLAGLVPISAGKILLKNRSLKEYSRRELALELAYVAQAGGDDGLYTIQELALMGRCPYLGILGVESDKDIAIAKQAIDHTGLSHLADRRMDSVSGGERQRAHISRAICQATDLILLDEPTAALDLAHQIKIMELMTNLKKSKGTTIVMVSHDLNLAAMYADRLLLLVDGRLMQCGPPKEVIDEKTLNKAYKCQVLVDQSPIGDWPRVNLIKSC